MRAWELVLGVVVVALAWRGGVYSSPAAMGVPHWRPEANNASIIHGVPFNDDIADFAQYLKERQSKEGQGMTERASPGLHDAIKLRNIAHEEPSRNPPGLQEMVGLRDDAFLMEEGLGEALGSWLRRGRRAEEGGETETSDDDAQESEAQEKEEPEAEDADSESSTARSAPPGDEEAAEDEQSSDAEVHMPEPRFVKDKYIQLPEPMIYNESHIVSSLVYSMIPFRSPLLSLLDPDRHAKYIMIKVDPVLSWSQSRGNTASEEGAGREARLEQSLIDLLDRSIGHELAERPVATKLNKMKGRTESRRTGVPSTKPRTNHGGK